ncbi:MAG: hypothetical protein ABSC48_13245 [Terracidiphilus sp.]
MQQAAETRASGDRSSPLGWQSLPSPTSPDFADLLAALAARTKEPASAWNEDGLEDDVAILSYERALRSHTRYGSSAPTDQSLTQAVDQRPIPLEEASSAVSGAGPQPEARPATFPKVPANPDAQPNHLPVARFERSLMDASITIRMSKAECEQLRRRAAEAGLTVSAYLRSCTVEAESLRAMVKETLAQLRSAAAQPKLANPAPPQRARLSSLSGKLTHILTPWRDSPRPARA